MPRISPRSLLDLLLYGLVRVTICVAQALPLETCDRLSRALAWVFARPLGIRRAVVEENLMHAFPHLSRAERDELLLKMWQHLFLFAAEVAQAPRKIHESNWRDYVELRNTAPLVKALLADRPIIMLSAHFGNFELGGYVLGLLGFPTCSVARDLDNPYLHRFVTRFRGVTGQRMIPKNGGYDQIVDVLSRGGTMALLADQYAGRKGCWVDFFGRPASAHKAIALLALNHDALLATGYARRIGRPLRYEFVTQSVVDPRQFASSEDPVKEITQWYTHQFEEAIRTAPEQYWWVHRRWKVPRRRGRRQLRKAA